MLKVITRYRLRKNACPVEKKRGRRYSKGVGGAASLERLSARLRRIFFSGVNGARASHALLRAGSPARRDVKVEIRTSARLFQWTGWISPRRWCGADAR